MRIGGAHSAHLHTPQSCELRQTWLPFRLCLSYIRLPSYSHPISVHPPHGNICNGYHLMITVRAANTLEVTRKHIKVSLCTYNSRVHCIYWWNTFSVLFVTHVASAPSYMLSEVWTGRSTMCLIKKTLLPPSSTVSTSSHCLFHPPLSHGHCVVFICTESFPQWLTSITVEPIPLSPTLL